MARLTIHSARVILLTAALIGGSTCWAGAAAPAPPIANLATNPSVERPDPGRADCPAGFRPGRVPGGQRKAKLTWEGPGHTGKKAIAVETLDSSDLGYWETVVPVKPLTDYVLSVAYKCRSAAPGGASQGDPAYNKGRPGGPNLELGAVAGDEPPAKPKPWTDIGWALDPVGGAYLPLATRWALHRQTARTVAGQTRLRIKLRVFCYAQKVWFDDLSVVEAASIPKVAIVAPADDAVVGDGKPAFQWRGPQGSSAYVLECSPSPAFSGDTTRRADGIRGERFALRDRLPPGLWFWHVGVTDQHGVPFWLAEGSFHAVERGWAARDTTPPSVFLPKPVPNASAEADATIAASFSDAGSGIDPPSARIVLDGRDVTAHATVTKDGLTLRPPRPLAKGAHRVAVSVADKAGNRSNRLAWQFGVGTPLRNETRLHNGAYLLNGEPFFPIGIYCYRLHPSDGRFSEASLSQAVRRGFDVLLNTIEPQNGLKNLDKLLSHGMKCLLNISTDMRRCDTPASANAALLEKGQARFRNHPCVLGYWADDPENLEDTKGTPIPKGTLAKMANTRTVLKEHSPHYPLVWAMSNLPRFKDGVPSADILLAYRYPVPQYHPQMIHGWTLHYVYSVSGHKPVWFNSQALDLGYGASLRCGHKYGTPFKPTDILRPTPAEMRAMAYYSLVLGVRGFSLYANYVSPTSHPAHWPEALRLATELRHLAPALAAGRHATAASLQPDTASGSICFREIAHDGAHTLIAVNMSAGRVAARWQFWRPTRAAVLFEDRAMGKRSHEMCDLFEPFGVHVYTWR